MTNTFRKRIWLAMVFLCLSTAAFAEPIDYMRKAAEQGDAVAQFSLGFMYDIGEGVPKDDREAVKWYRLAAEQGYASAQFGLGRMYANGRGVPEDDREAVRWYRLAAEQGKPWAQAELGFMYSLGLGVPEDDREAVKWYRLAAEQGLAEAQFHLGFMYESGEGVPKNHQEAYIWYSLAVASGSDNKNATIYKNRAKQNLSRAEQLAAQRAVTRHWNEIAERHTGKTTLPSSSPVRDNITPGTGGIFHFSGTIKHGDAQRLEARIKAGGVRAVTFDSTGGQMSESIAIGRLIRDNLIRTEVPHYAKCYSACVFAFVGGVERVSDGSLGIHSFYSNEFMGTGNFTEASEMYDQASNALEAYLKEMRIPVALLDHMKRVSHRDMDILDAEKLREYFLEGIDPVYQQTHKNMGSAAVDAMADGAETANFLDLLLVSFGGCIAGMLFYSKKVAVDRAPFFVYYAGSMWVTNIVGAVCLIPLGYFGHLENEALFNTVQYGTSFVNGILIGIVSAMRSNAIIGHRWLAVFGVVPIAFLWLVFMESKDNGIRKHQPIDLFQGTSGAWIAGILYIAFVVAFPLN